MALEAVEEAMTDDDRQTGPWALALGTLAIGVGAMAELLRRRRERTGERDRAGASDDTHR